MAAGGRHAAVLRACLPDSEGAWVVNPRQYALSRADQAFDEAGALKDDKARQSMEGVVESLLKLAAALRVSR